MNDFSTILAAASQAEAGEPSLFEQILLVLGLGIAGIYALKRAAANWLRKSAALERAQRLSHTERDAVEREILDHLHSAPGQTLQVRAIAGILGEHEAYIDFVLQPLIKWEFVVSSICPTARPRSILTNTPELRSLQMAIEGFEKRIRLCSTMATISTSETTAQVSVKAS